MLDPDSNTLQRFSGIADLLYTEISIRSVPEGYFGSFPIGNGNILRGTIRQQMVFRGNQLGNGVIAHLNIRNLNDTVIVGREGAEHIALGRNHLKDSALQRLLRPLLQLDDPQSSLLRLLGFFWFLRIFRIFGFRVIWNRNVGIVGKFADYRGRNGNIRIGIEHIVLDFTIFVCLKTACVVDGVLYHDAAHVDLNTARFPLYSRGRIHNLTLPFVPHITWFRNGQTVNFLIVHIQQLGSCRDITSQAKFKGFQQPGITFNGDDLLIIVLAVDGNGIGGILIHRGGHFWGNQFIPDHAAVIDVNGSLQNPFRSCSL